MLDTKENAYKKLLYKQGLESTVDTLKSLYENTNTPICITCFETSKDCRCSDIQKEIYEYNLAIIAIKLKYLDEL